MTRVLVPLDGSELAESVLPWLPFLLDPDDHDLVLARATDEEADVAAADAYLAKQQSNFGSSCRVRREQGEAVETILRCAAEEGSQLIAMATHGRSGLRRWLLGSVAEEVLRRASAPVFLVGPDATPPESLQRILVAHDGSEGSDAVLPLVTKVASGAEAAVSLLRVQPFIPVALPSPVLHPELNWDPEALEASLAEPRAKLEGAGLKVDIQVRLGHEPTEILAAAKDADLIALSTHGRSGAARWWFGSVCEQVLRQSEKPLLVVRTSSPE